MLQTNSAAAITLSVIIRENVGLESFLILKACRALLIFVSSALNQYTLRGVTTVTGRRLVY